MKLRSLRRMGKCPSVTEPDRLLGSMSGKSLDALWGPVSFRVWDRIRGPVAGKLAGRIT